ncbi:hypothetical protein RvY_14640-2 [Ramazzottius varieornatus]|uniref:SLC26A/SulP transporter domain-containing protein n=1 Tax=Ramazzottius varieornatus TaxID=947166 RepID=A0A1D1VS49_RAMVA|nr:hypothetical protein RvY_14640-2 [Ramazzottius varieornatus]
MATTDPNFQAYVDSEKGEIGDSSDDEEVENPSEIQPRFFRTPSVDLVPSAARVAAARRRSSARAESLRREKSTGAASPESVKLRSPSIHEAREERGNRSEQYVGDTTIKTAYEPLEPDDQEVIRFGGPYTLKDLKNELSGLCTLQTLQRKLPITRWLPKYSREDFKGDLVAGLTVGLTVVPQCLAYAQIADIKLEFGLNSAYMGCFCYALFGTSKDVTVGPTAILSLLTGAFIHREHGLEGKSAILLCFLVGCFQLMMGFLRLGFLM